MSKTIQRIKGMYDVWSPEGNRWRHLERQVKQTLEQHGYGELRLPLVESVELFARAVGEETDVVGKEMYAFEDRNGDWIALRPEGTASVVRALLDDGFRRDQTRKLFYHGPMFRHENVQRGRNRQFHQIGAEALGWSGPDIDAEQLIMLDRLFRELDIRQHLTLEINSLGTAAERTAYREVLVDYLNQHHDQLDQDSQRRLQTNPLRILDSKNPAMQPLIDAAPRFADHRGEDSNAHFEELQQILNRLDVPFVVNPTLVRGLDYYNRTVFEWTTDQLGAQGTVCAGGRYDGLVAQQGGPETPAIGFAMGVERLVELLSTDLPEPTAPQVYVAALAGDDSAIETLALAEQLRTALPGRAIMNHLGGGRFKGVLKRADRVGADYVVLVGAQESADQTLTIKPLRSDGDQTTKPMQEAIAWLRSQTA